MGGPPDPPGLKSPNGIEWYFKIRVMQTGDYRDGIQFTKGKGFVHAFNVAADDMKEHPGRMREVARFV